MAHFVHRVSVQSFRCLESVEFGLTELHAFVGPNDSGKSTLLEAIAQTVAMAAGSGKGPGASCSVDFANQVVVARPAKQISPPHGEGVIIKTAKGLTDQASARRVPELSALVKDVPCLRLDADRLREPTHLIRSTTGRIWFSDDRGLGLPAIYDVLLNRSLNDFLAIQESVRALFPTVESVVLDTPDEKTKSIGVRLRNGTQVPARHMGEGLLYFLAYAAVQYIGPAPVLLIEEPENGLHPARVADVVRVLREVAKKSQVILATHSPLVINELQPEEVSVVTRDPLAGTKVTPISATPSFEERSKVYRLGELWLAYSDGASEKALLEGGPRP